MTIKKAVTAKPASASAKKAAARMPPHVGDREDYRPDYRNQAAPAAESYSDAHGVITNGRWKPTKEEYAAYQKRDLELAVENLRPVREDRRMHEQTLHAPKTQLRAIGILADYELHGTGGVTA